MDGRKSPIGVLSLLRYCKGIPVFESRGLHSLTRESIFLTHTYATSLKGKERNNM